MSAVVAALVANKDVGLYNEVMTDLYTSSNTNEVRNSTLIW